MSSPKLTPFLELSNIDRFFQSGDTIVRALDGVSLDIFEGEFVAVMGQSGSGKSTLMNIIGCLDRATSGSYRVLGQDVANLNSDQLAALRRDTFGFIFQRYNLLATASAIENIAMPAIYAAVPKNKRDKRALDLLDKLRMSDRADHLPHQLSGGQQQRVAVARALVNDPPIILADEPTGALDSQSGREVLELLIQLNAEGRTIILITHDEKIASYADRIIKITDGKICADSKTDNCVSIKERKEISHTNLTAAHVSLATEAIEATKLALRSLRVNLFRTALTLLGIIIGVASVIVMLAIGDGSKQKILSQITAMGTNLLYVRPGAPGIRGGGDIVSLIPGDAEAVGELENVEAVVPERSGRFTARFGNIDYQTTIQATGRSFPYARDWPPVQGTFFNERDLQSYAPVAVLGTTVATNLFPNGEDPIGHYILIKNVPFEIIGVMATKGASGWGNDQDDVIFVPLSTGLIRLFGKQYLSSMTIKVSDVDKIEETQNRITEILIARHRSEDFAIRNMASLLDTITATQTTLTILLGAVAAISLLVGGIGVMNIMLVNITERTREIGIRMATGARMRDILLQFNTESAVVCTVGGILGILLGFAVGWFLQLFGISTIFSILPIALAFSCAVGTGLIFGYLPARTAAQMDPVLALASE